MRVLLSILFLLIAGNVFADVTWERISQKIDDNGNIEIHTQYKFNGVEVVSEYPQEDGKYIWVTRYDAINFHGLSKVEVDIKIQKYLGDFAKYLILRPVLEEQRQALKDKNLEIFNSEIFTDSDGKTGSLSFAEIDIDTDFDGKPDTRFIVDTNGNKEVGVFEEVAP